MNLQNIQAAFVQDLIETKKTFHISYQAFNAITKEIYGKRIEILETPNDTTHQADVDGEDIDEDELLEAIECGGIECWRIELVLNDLCRRELLEAGQYFIRVSW